jgi:uncharacterized protein YjiS (DUF1127 family)
MKHPDWTDTILASPRLPAPPLTLRWLRRLLAQLPIWLERSRQRRQLASLDDYMLRDIGVSRSMASGETEKWFWRP